MINVSLYNAFELSEKLKISEDEANRIIGIALTLLVISDKQNTGEYLFNNDTGELLRIAGNHRIKAKDQYGPAFWMLDDICFKNGLMYSYINHGGKNSLLFVGKDWPDTKASAVEEAAQAA